MKMIKLPNNKATLAHYELILTENCNLRCKYCFDNSFSDRSHCLYNYKMNVDLIDPLIDFINATRSPNEGITVTLFGGEPTLNWEFFTKFVLEAKKRIPQIRFNTNTNATNLTPEIVDFLVEQKIGVSISIDGTRRGNDATRIFKGGKGSWETIISNLPLVLGKFHAAQQNVCAMMVVDDRNYQYLAEDYLFLIKIGFADVNILWNFSCDYNEKKLSVIESQLIYLFKDLKCKPYLDFKRRILNKNFLEKSNHYCNSPDYSATINCKGDIFFCHRLVPKMNDELIDSNAEKFGNIWEGYSEKYQEYFHKIEKRTSLEGFLEENPSCKDCPALPLCKGGCIGAIRNETGSYGILPSFCKLQKLLTKLFIKD